MALSIIKKFKLYVGSKINKILDLGNFNIEKVGIYSDDFEEDLDDDIVELCHDLITYGRVE